MFQDHIHILVGRFEAMLCYYLRNFRYYLGLLRLSRPLLYR